MHPCTNRIGIGCRRQIPFKVRLVRQLIVALPLSIFRLAAAFCFETAGQVHRIDPLLLEAIATVESNLQPNAMHHNANGTRDIGLMQINSMHLPHLKARGIDERRLMAQPCLSVMVAAEILAALIARHGYGWYAVGAYNAGSATARASARRRYIDKVWACYAHLLATKSGVRPVAFRAY
ncbi:transglycosylase SLT domain-containing protein [Robbsia andropogonis]|uniref:transglycosylase SLT domain-containing protein n=1 Tax=Robbsia andropogonis TaxID=28092 RepID=UPI0004639FBE|nr:transglycosylase SLT domain-containing protein [Robbsia andropogonis]MCP1118268.1 transglycosylase SLT domain-containing protein [Robbsia andropogonis]MCP1127954.1 transglycosylase SLT domain-containing protein [Robbsia andropogonis]